MLTDASVTAWAPVLINLVVAAFIYGGLYVQVKNSKDDIKEIKEDKDAQWKTINKHGERIAAIEGRSQGKANGMTAGH